MPHQWWSLDQAIAWVMTRDEGIVKLLKGGWIFSLISYPDTFGFVNPADSKKAKPFLGDKNDLLARLRSGKIVASGQCIERGAYRHQRRDMLPTEWQWLELNTAAPPGGDRVEAFGEGVPSWGNIRFSVDSLKRHFPETPLPPLEMPDSQDLEQIVASLVAECRREGSVLNRETLYSAVNMRLAKGRVTAEWAREAIKKIPPDVKNLRRRPPKNKTAA